MCGSNGERVSAEGAVQLIHVARGIVWLVVLAALGQQETLPSLRRLGMNRSVGID